VKNVLLIRFLINTITLSSSFHLKEKEAKCIFRKIIDSIRNYFKIVFVQKSLTNHV